MATRWGIVSCGLISHDFVTAVRSIGGEEHKVVAVSARNLESAEKFAKLHNVSKAYGSYEELSQDEEVEVVYIGSINTTHLPVAEMMLAKGKHLLVEKPLCMNVKETERLLAAAKKHGRFLMEAVWSRFLPAYRNLMERLAAGEIGDVVNVNVTFGVKVDTVERLAKKELGGGATLDIGVYCMNAVAMVFGSEPPLKMAAVGHLNENGVDKKLAVAMSFSGGRQATFIADTTVELGNELHVYGTKGTLKLLKPMWSSTAVVSDSGISEFPMPPTVLPCNYINSSGLRYQAVEVRKCIRQGLLESPIMSHKHSLFQAKLLQEARTQVGVSYPQDDE